MWRTSGYSFDTWGNETDRKLNPRGSDMQRLGDENFYRKFEDDYHYNYYLRPFDPELDRDVIPTRRAELGEKGFRPAYDSSYDRDKLREQQWRDKQHPSDMWARHMRRLIAGEQWNEELQRERKETKIHITENPQQQQQQQQRQGQATLLQQETEERSRSYDADLDRFTAEGGYVGPERQGDIPEESGYSESRRDTGIGMHAPQKHSESYGRDFTGYDFGYGFHDARGSARNTWRNYGKRGWELPYFQGWWRPRTDILEEENKLRIEVELPGVPKDNIRLVLTDDYLIVSTLKPQSHAERKAFVCQNERHFGNFYRQLFFPYLIDTRTASAVLDKGVLKITLHKATQGIASGELRTTEGTYVGTGGVRGLIRIREGYDKPGLRDESTAQTPSVGTSRKETQQRQQQHKVEHVSSALGRSIEPDIRSSRVRVSDGDVILGISDNASTIASAGMASLSEYRPVETTSDATLDAFASK